MVQPVSFDADASIVRRPMMSNGSHVDTEPAGTTVSGSSSSSSQTPVTIAAVSQSAVISTNFKTVSHDIITIMMVQ